MNDIKKILQLINENAADAAKSVGTEFGAPAAAGLTAGTIAKKMGSKIVPGVGTALSWKDAWDRWKQGDRSGSVIAALAGAAFMAPGPGTMIGTALDAANIGRDIKKGDYDELGQAIKDKFAKEDQTENKMKESERIAQLRNKLDQIDEALPVSLIKGAKAPAVAKPAGAVPKKDPNVIDVDAKEIKPGMTPGQKAAAGAVGAAAAVRPWDSGIDAATGPDQSDAETARLARQNAAAAPKPAAPKPPAGSSANPPAAALSPEEEGEMGVLAQEFGSHMGRLPELDALLLRYEKLRPKAADAAP